VRIASCKGQGCAQRGQFLQKLQARHDEVVRHENAHHREAGDLAKSGPVLTDYVEGPDRKQYATGGHVIIDTSETGDPEKDLRRGQTIVRSAEAPLGVGSDLSQADITVAAKGRQIIAKSEQKLGKLNNLKNAVGGSVKNLSSSQVATLAKGLGLEMSPGRILNLLA
jgi:hypothetical protein